MEIKLEKINHSTDIPLEIKDLYHAAFPEEERREWSDIIRRIETGDPIFDFYVLQHNSETIGFITLWNLPGALYCEHFATLHRCRNKGFGAAVIQEVINMTGNRPLVLEVELPGASEFADSRISFYERCGLTPLEDFPYWQPPYRQGLPEVPMMLVSSKPLHDPTAFAMILHTIVYNQ